MAQMLAIAIPVLPGRGEQRKSFMKDLSSKYKQDFIQSRKALKVRERVFLQSTPQGELVIVTLEGENPEQAFARFGAGNGAYTQWFVQQVKEIHGVDLTKPPQGAMPKLVVDSQ